MSKRQTIFFLPVDPVDKEHKDPGEIDLEAPRLARYMHTAWKKHQNTVYWVDIKLAQKKRLKLYQTRSNAIILYDTLPAYFISKAVRTETGGILYEKVYVSPRPPPKISLRNNWMKELGSEVARQAEGSQPTQPKTPNPIHRTGRLVETAQTSRSSAQEIDTRFSLGCESTNVSVERSDKDKDADESVDADRVRTEFRRARKFRTIRRQPETARKGRGDVDELVGDPFDPKPKSSTATCGAEPPLDLQVGHVTSIDQTVIPEGASQR